jgi:hypothetical protein
VTEAAPGVYFIDLLLDGIELQPVNLALDAQWPRPIHRNGDERV